MCSNHTADKVRLWLAAPDSSEIKNEASNKRQVDTCAWFLGGERFRTWLENSGFLWVKGKRKFLRQFCIHMFNIYSGMR